MCRKKGILYLLKAFKELAVENVDLVLVGDTKQESGYYRQILKYIDENELIKRINIMGSMPSEELHEQYSRADIFVLPSLNEGYGMVLLEAMYHKLPVVATAVGGIPELVKDGFSGILVPPRDSTRMAIAVKRLINDKDLRARFAQNAYNSNMDKMRSWDKVGEDICNIVNSLN